MRAIIDVAPRGAVFETAAEQMAAGDNADYRLHFESPRLLLSHLTTTRMELLESLRQHGACSVYRLAKVTGRNYSNVHRDVVALENLGLLERNDVDAVFVPFDAVEIHMELAMA